MHVCMAVVLAAVMALAMLLVVSMHFGVIMNHALLVKVGIKLLLVVSMGILLPTCHKGVPHSPPEPSHPTSLAIPPCASSLCFLIPLS